MKEWVSVAAALLLGGSVVAEENLLRDDFASDNVGATQEAKDMVRK